MFGFIAFLLLSLMGLIGDVWESTFPDGFDVNDEIFSQVLDAIKEQETGGEADPDNAVGDDGAALGSFQIWESYWTDAVEKDPSLTENGETYQSVTDESYARKVVTAYMNRYAIESRIGSDPSVEDVARIHNGGPNGYKKESTLEYWDAVKEIIISKAGGDPHFYMWDNTRFSYHGECDLVLVHVPNFVSGSALSIHVRTEIRSQYSIIKNVAIGIGSDVFEVAGEEEYYVNGIRSVQPPSIFAGYPIKKLNETKRCLKFDRCPKTVLLEVDFSFYGSVELTIWKDIIWISISGSTVGFRRAVGLMGKWDKSGMFARDDITKLDDSNDFGQEWQGRDTEPRLFNKKKRSPQYPKPCIPAPEVESRRFEVGSKFYSMAEDACSHISEDSREMCLFDVLATGDLDIAYVPFH